MTYLLDTHVLLWLLEKESLIPAKTLSDLQKPGNQLLVSIVSIWEIGIKQSLGKISLTRSLQDVVNELPGLAIDLMPILPSHIIELTKLPFHHHDPFDRLLIAQAIVEDATVVSKDAYFPLYTLSVQWQ
ncbi:type II toxin-antitoxin system VapC family toxin [Larkinella ripae]